MSIYTISVSAPRRKHSKPHLSSVADIIDSTQLDLSPTPQIPSVCDISIPIADVIIHDPADYETYNVATRLPVSEYDMRMPQTDNLLLAPDEEGSAGHFATESPAFSAGIAKPDKDHKLLPVLGGRHIIQVPKRIDKLQEEYILSMCTRDDLQRALAACESLHIQRFANDLTNLKYADKGIAFLARKHAISPLELTDIWRRHCMAQGMLNLISGIPQMANDIIEDSKSKMISCERCDGLGEVEDVRAMTQARRSDPEGSQVEPIYRVCPACKGNGEIRIEGSTDARKLALEAAGVVGKKATIIGTANIQAHNVESVIGELENLQIDAMTRR